MVVDANGQYTPDYRPGTSSRQCLSYNILHSDEPQTHDRIPDTTLDVEPRRLILHIPDQLDLDLNLTLPDSEIAATIPHESDRLLELKRQRVFNVQGAVAEWRVAEKQLVIGV